MLVVERCHLNVEAMAAGPYAAGLSVLTDDELDLGAAVVEMGAGTTTSRPIPAADAAMRAASRSAAITSPSVWRAASGLALRMPSRSRRYMARC